MLYNVYCDDGYYSQAPASRVPVPVAPVLPKPPLSFPVR